MLLLKLALLVLLLVPEGGAQGRGRRHRIAPSNAAGANEPPNYDRWTVLTTVDSGYYDFFVNW